MVYKDKSKDKGKKSYGEFKWQKKFTGSKFERATKGKLEDEYYVDVPFMGLWAEREEY